MSRRNHITETDSIVLSKRLKGIVDGALDGLQVIEQWHATSTDHPQLQEIIQKIRDHALLYFEVIDTSLKAAQDDYCLSCDAIELCGYLLNPQSDQAQTQKHILDIQYKTKHTQENSVVPLSKFRDIRISLITVKNIVSIERIVGQEVVPGIYVRLSPLMLGKGQYTRLDIARKQLNQLALGIAELIDSLDKFAAWWCEVHEVVKKLELMADALSTEKESLRVRSIQRGWQIMRDDYTKYNVEVSLLQGRFRIQDSPEAEYTTQCEALGAIFENSLDSLQIMDPWRKACTDHLQLEQIIRRIRDYAWLYFEAIDASLKAAQEGYCLSSDAIKLYTHLLDPKPDQAELQNCISDIKHKAKRTHQISVATLDKFRKVRLDLFKTTEEIPTHVILSPESDKRTFITLISPMVGNGRFSSFDTALKESNLIPLDVAKLANNANQFTDWWNAAEIVSTVVEDRSSALKEVEEEEQAEGAQRTWMNLRDKYKQYLDQIIQLQDHYNPDPLRELEGVAPFENLKAIVEAAFDSLKIITPWRNATTDHPQLQQVIKEIQNHAVIYLDAINTSINTAQDGYAFSSNAIGLCGYLLDPTTDIEELRKYIEIMCGKAKSARNDSMIALDKFRDVRKGLLEIEKKIPREALVNSVDKKNIVIRLLSHVFGEKRDMDLEAAMKELNLVALNVAKLAEDVGKFAGWWVEMETALEKTEKDASGLKPGRDKLRVKAIRKQWTVIRDDYKQYKVQVRRVEDHLLSGE